ncbi:MAG: FecR domain-containing protein [Candidatus Pedobacter colombiensis]|uniref:FecR domain-containing protein n=1 Tax=Candidatus Pedobacter colombiensis TaxID=3121371 RepID=A0AAJ6B8A1_9SPHI|nr:FecR domain-containing protein [Pedobacter sp.]WEK21180.1 MAG: FecR domain-containing protein [Pedobacter sp.]
MTDELLIKFLLKETNEEESVRVQNWLDTTPSNKAYFLQFEKIWNTSKTLSSQSKINEDDAWLRFQQKATSSNSITRRLMPAYNWLKVAAVFVIIAAGWSLYNLLKPVSYITIAAGNTVTTKVLPDGSDLTLNKNTSISYANNFKNNRSIHLQHGDVFFNVAHDKTKPFVIEIDKVSVLVVGTSFNIKHLDNQTEVIVETGIVKVTLGKDQISLQKGEKVMIKNNTSKLIKEQITDHLYDYYRSKEFIVNNTPLWRMVEVLNEAYNTNITINDPAIKNLTLNTTLRASASLDYNLNLICRTLDITMVRNQNQILLSNHQ